MEPKNPLLTGCLDNEQIKAPCSRLQGAFIFEVDFQA